MGASFPKRIPGAVEIHGAQNCSVRRRLSKSDAVVGF
jgi:hypothetical protein